MKDKGKRIWSRVILCSWIAVFCVGLLASGLAVGWVVSDDSHREPVIPQVGLFQDSMKGWRRCEEKLSIVTHVRDFCTREYQQALLELQRLRRPRRVMWGDPCRLNMHDKHWLRVLGACVKQLDSCEARGKR